jgi:hypothetical protein
MLCWDGISLQGPALRALQSVGVLDQCIERGFGYSHFKAYDAMGNVTGTVDLPRLRGPTYPAHNRHPTSVGSRGARPRPGKTEPMLSCRRSCVICLPSLAAHSDRPVKKYVPLSRLPADQYFQLS